MPHLMLRKPPGEALKSLARASLSRTARRMGEAKAGAKVHGARRDLKRARSLLRMAAAAIGGDAFVETDRLLREAGKLLTGARRAEARLETVARLEAGSGATELRQWASTRAAAQPLATATTEVAEAEQLVIAARKLVGKWKLPRHDISPILNGIRSSYGKARKGLRRGLAAHDTEQLHRARRSVIHHLHHIEALQSVYPPLFKAWLAELNALRVALGELNDLEDLEKEISESGGDRPDSAEPIAAQRAALFKVIAAKSGLLFAEKPSAFAARMEAMWHHAKE